MEQYIEDFKEVVEERNYAQDMYIETSKELDEKMDEIIAVKKERNELRERLKKQQEGELAYTDIWAELVASAKAQSKIGYIKEDSEKRKKDIDGARSRKSKNKNN